ncbi:hypothetical protein [Corallococcus llansteffanensis]|uniref:Uncharacterized protein n=1 Tax=Corallococcus llansteffanensis TaxID=2316731 RepID=A0A3A8PRF2_9BACT|nr:hypothetical protein [Corallococcus llansteffanensis]RKH58839.1 hypothetical protein D7V93_16095 [Corallococcus llansteffanensis]
MKVEGQEAPSGPEKVPPEKDAFQQVLQQTSGRGSAPVRPGSTARRGMPPVPGGPPKAVPSRPGGLLPSSIGPSTRASSSPPQVRASGAILSTARSALGSPETLRQARQGMHVEMQRLGTVRQEAQAEGHEQATHRASDLIARELERSLRSEARPAPVQAPTPSSTRTDSPAGSAPLASVTEGRGAAVGAGPASSTPVAQVESMLALIEKIEVFVKSQRPALGLSLRGSLEATVEVERTGPREVALRIQGRHGPVPTEDVARLRDALEARGLRLSVLRAD